MQEKAIISRICNAVFPSHTPATHPFMSTYPCSSARIMNIVPKKTHHFRNICALFCWRRCPWDPPSFGCPCARMLRSWDLHLPATSPPLGFLSGYSVHFGSAVCCHPPSSLARRNLIPTGKKRGRTFDHIDREIARSLCRCSLRLESSRGGESHRVVYGGICDILPISMAVTFLKPRGSLHRT